jgi:hypothetical protein
MQSQADHAATSVDQAGIHVPPEMVAATVNRALRDRQVHWFVRAEDQGAQDVFDQTPMAQRRDLMRPSTGY